VVTVRDAAGRPVGMTASSLASVSLVPPLVSVCVDVSAEMHRMLSVAPAYAVNILSDAQEPLSRRFADLPIGERFAGIPFRETPTGLIVLVGALAHIECERHADFPLGDHTLFVGRVIGGETSEGKPLLYYRGEYGALRSG
jgi:3-hydroxy-9,10-secoandrosta-1,3,5(10)-triene-9,17-dione monooxygenase reductase component